MPFSFLALIYFFMRRVYDFLQKIWRVRKGIAGAFAGIVGIVLFSKRKQMKKEYQKIEKKVGRAAQQAGDKIEEAYQEFYKKLFRHFKDFAIPHEGNSHRPKGLQPKALTAYVIVIVLVKFLVTGTLFFIYPNPARLSEKMTDELLTLTNQARQDIGVPVVSSNDILAAAARSKAKDMIANGYFAHFGPDGKKPWEWIDQGAYQFLYMGENLAMDFSSAEVVHQAFMNSASHRKNILNSKYTDIGMGIAMGKINGRDTIVLVQFFATPKVTPSFAAALQVPETIAANETISAPSPTPASPPPAPQQTKIVKNTVEPTQFTSANEADEEDKTGGAPSDTQLAFEDVGKDEQKNISADNAVKERRKVLSLTGKNQDRQPAETPEGNQSETERPEEFSPDSERSQIAGATLVVVDDPSLKRGLVDKMVSWSHNFLALMLIVLLLLFLVNTLIKIQVQHAPTIVHSLLVIALVALALSTRVHIIEQFIR